MKQQIRIPATPNRVGIIERVAKALHALPATLSWTVTVEQHKPKRSNSQNALLWAMYEQIIQVARARLPDATKEELHEFFLIQHYGAVRKEYFGMPKLSAARRSSSLNRQEFSEHVEFILAYMAQEGFLIEMPEDYREAVAAWTASNTTNTCGRSHAALAQAAERGPPVRRLAQRHD